MNSLRRPLLLLLCVVMLAATSWADERRPWEKYFYEMMADESSGMDENDYETLCDMEQHPLDINTATRDELSQLPFLTATQIEDIHEYIYRHGAMRSLGELLLIRSLDFARRQLLACFVFLGGGEKNKVKRNIISDGHSQLLATVSQPLYKRKGDRNGYLGYNTKHSFRYTFESGGRLRLGLLGSQDSGEPFFSGKNGMGYDHYSYYVQLRKMGAVENIVAGHFVVQFGMGLVANTGFSLGKSLMLSTLGRTVNTIRPSLSRSVANYMQGVAATVRIAKPLSISAFASYRPIDATLNSDDGSIKTIVTTGYHRTPTEMAKKNNSHSATMGLNLRYTRNGFHAGTTAVYTHFDRELRPQTSTLYRRYYPSGNDFFNIGVDYGYTGHTLSASGETAIDRQGAVATLNTVSVNVADGLSLMALYRYYSHKYTSLYANSFSDGGHVRNEHGAYIGVDWRPTPTLSIDAYADYAYAPWARYRTSLPSHSFDAMLSASLQVKRLTLSGRYRMRMRYLDNDDKTAIVRHTGHRTRLRAYYDFGGGWSTTTQADLAITEYKTNDRGFMLSQSINGQWRWLRMNASANYFHTDSYESRIYAYERGTLHSFAFPAFYGHGLRYALMLRADFCRQLMAIAKVGVTDYFDRATISSGLQQIEASSKCDVDMQIRWKF